jgi:uncharacterized Fe-S radical SAM superfamily protein PflX
MAAYSEKRTKYINTICEIKCGVTDVEEGYCRLHIVTTVI